ncbi:MAG: hypothetical protein EBX50_16845 [Chitinophagia bacterium]|nr:hypothetical protein [Chitinophagia bacterium]
MYQDLLLFILFLIIFKFSLDILVNKTRKFDNSNFDILKNEYSSKVNSILPTENNKWLPSGTKLIIPSSKDNTLLFVNQPYVFYDQNQPTQLQISTSIPITYPPNDLVNIINNQKTSKEYKQVSYTKTTLGSTCKSSKECEDGLICGGNNNTSGNLLPVEYTCKRVIATMPCNHYSCINPYIKQNINIKDNTTFNISELGDFCGGNTGNIIGNTCNTNGNLICLSDNIISTSSGICLNKLD